MWKSLSLSLRVSYSRCVLKAGGDRTVIRPILYTWLHVGRHDCGSHPALELPLRKCGYVIGVLLCTFPQLFGSKGVQSFESQDSCHFTLTSGCLFVWAIVWAWALWIIQQTMGSSCARTIDVSHIERRPTTTETRVAYDNSTWHAINTRWAYKNFTKETSRLELLFCEWDLAPYKLKHCNYYYKYCNYY